MDVRVNDVQSSVRATDSQRLLDPRIMAEIVERCVRAVRDDMENERRRGADRQISDGVSPSRY